MSNFSEFIWYNVTSRAKSVQEVADSFCWPEEDVIFELQHQTRDKNIRKNLLFAYYWNKCDSISLALNNLSFYTAIHYDRMVASVKASNLRKKGWKLKSFSDKTQKFNKNVFWCIK